MKATFENIEVGTFLTHPDHPDQMARVAQKSDDQVVLHCVPFTDECPQPTFTRDAFDSLNYQIVEQSTQDPE